MSWLSRLIDSFRAGPKPDPLASIQPRVTPDPQHVAGLHRRYADLAYSPSNGFHRDQRQHRSNVVQLRRRAR